MGKLSILCLLCVPAFLLAVDLALPKDVQQLTKAEQTKWLGHANALRFEFTIKDNEVEQVPKAFWAYVARCDKRCAEAIIETDREIADWKRRMDASRTGYADTKFERDKQIAQMRPRLDSLQKNRAALLKYVRDAKNKWPRDLFPVAIELQQGSIGTLGDPRVFQISDDHQMIIQTGAGVSIWLAGVSTKGIVDGAFINPAGLFQITGTKRYDTAMGSQKTILLAEPLDITAFQEGLSYEQLGAFLSRKGYGAGVFVKEMDVLKATNPKDYARVFADELQAPPTTSPVR